MDVVVFAMAIMINSLAYAMALTGEKPWMIRKILDAQRSI
jgi:hypothetical protein